MTQIYSLFIAILLVPALGFAKSYQADTAYELFKLYSPEAAEKLKEPVRSWKVSGVRASKGLLSFKLEGAPLVYKWVGTPKVALTLNGHAITQEQFKNKKLFKRKVLSLLKLRHREKRFSLWDWIVPQAYAMNVGGLNLFSLIRNLQPNHSAFWSRLMKGDNFSTEKSRLAGFLGMDVSSLFGDGLRALSAPWPEPLNIPSPSTLSIDAGEPISVQ